MRLDGNVDRTIRFDRVRSSFALDYSFRLFCNFNFENRVTYRREKTRGRTEKYRVTFVLLSSLSYCESRKLKLEYLSDESSFDHVSSISSYVERAGASIYVENTACLRFLKIARLQNASLHFS